MWWDPHSNFTFSDLKIMCSDSKGVMILGSYMTFSATCPAT